MAENECNCGSGEGCDVHDKFWKDYSKRREPAEPSPTPATCPTCGSADRHVRNLAPPDAMWQTHCSDPWHEPPTPAGVKCKHCGKPKYLHREDNLACRWASEGKGGWSETYHYLPEVTQNVTESQPPQPAPQHVCTPNCNSDNCEVTASYHFEKVEQPAPAVGANAEDAMNLAFAYLNENTHLRDNFTKVGQAGVLAAFGMRFAAHVTAADKAKADALQTHSDALAHTIIAKDAEIAERDWMIDQMREAYDIIRVKWEQAESALKEAQKELDLRTISWNSALKGEGDNFQEILRLRSKLATLREKVKESEELLRDGKHHQAFHVICSIKGE